MKLKSESEVAQSCPTLSGPMDCSLPGSSVHGLCQARVLEWGAIAFPCYAEEANTMFVKKLYSNKKLEFISDFNKVGVPCSSAGKESTCSAGDLGSIPVLERSSGEGKGWPLQYSGLENSRDHTVHGVSKSQIQLSDFHLTRSLHIPVSNIN